MPPKPMTYLIAFLIFAVVTVPAFSPVMSLLDQRKAQARVLRDRLTTADEASASPARARPAAR